MSSHLQTEPTIWIGFIDIEQYQETEQEWSQLLSLVEPKSELDRMNRFRFRVDAKRSCLGHVFMQYYLMKHLELQNLSQVVFQRTEKNKPYLVRRCNQLTMSVHEATVIDFNISHGGDIVLFGYVSSGSSDVNEARVLGLDVEKVHFRLSKNVVNPYQDYLDTMNSCFTAAEWRTILRPLREMRIAEASDSGNDDATMSNAELLQLVDRAPQRIQQAVMKNFFVYWTLKESFMKATGMGVEIELQRMQFEYSTEDLSRNDACLVDFKPCLRLDGRVLPGWTFESCMIDEDHVASICIGPLKQIETAKVTSSHLRQCMTSHLRGASIPHNSSLTSSQQRLITGPFSSLVKKVSVEQVIAELAK